MDSQQHEEVLFGRIALFCGYIEKDQLIECLTFQAEEAAGEFIGDILLSRGYLGLEQVLRILLIQQENLQAQVERLQKKRIDVLFGNLCIEQGFADKGNIYHALRKQVESEREGKYKQIGEILVEQGILTPEQVSQILKEQQ